MPAVEQKTGSYYVWIISAFLLGSITAGGVLLAIYITQPEPSSWYPIAGILLVCLPWLFWLLTFLYRLLSRRLGFRMVLWGAGATTDSLPRSSTATTNSAPAAGPTAVEPSNVGGSAAAAGGGGGGGRRVHFGGAVVVGEENEDTDGSGSGRLSHESEAPLRNAAMAASS